MYNLDLDSNLHFYYSIIAEIAEKFSVTAVQSNWHHYRMIMDNLENQYACAMDAGRLLMHRETEKLVLLIIKRILYWNNENALNVSGCVVKKNAIISCYILIVL